MFESVFFLTMSFVFLFDWDGTITRHDTLSLVAPADDEILSGSQSFSVFGDAYMQDFDKFNLDFGEVDSKKRLYEYLQALRLVEERSLNRIEEQGLFKNTHESQRRARISHLVYRDGWDAMQTWMAHNELQAYIVSVNWSQTFICEALQESAKSVGVQSVIKKVYANMLETRPGTDECTGRIVGPYGLSRILTGLDKLRVSKNIMSTHPDATPVYVGDSATDIPCLLWADVGILIGAGDHVLEVLRRAGMVHFVCTPETWLTLDTRQRHASIVHVSNWNKVLDLLGS